MYDPGENMVPKPKDKMEKGDIDRCWSMMIVSMNVNQFDNDDDNENDNYDNASNDNDDDDKNDNDDNDSNENNKVENISNAEAARIMKSKLGKGSSNNTEVATMMMPWWYSRSYLLRKSWDFLSIL